VPASDKPGETPRWIVPDKLSETPSFEALPWTTTSGLRGNWNRQAALSGAVSTEQAGVAMQREQARPMTWVVECFHFCIVLYRIS
jgi:hypothetical protein